MKCSGVGVINDDGNSFEEMRRIRLGLPTTRALQSADEPVD